MTTNSATANLLESQFQKWTDLISQKKSTGETESGLKTWEHPVVTISNEAGCDFNAVALILARGFGLEIFDTDIVDLIAKSAHSSRRMVETLDEKTRSALDEWLAEDVFDDEFTSKTYLKNLRAVVFTIAAHGNAIIIGRGAAFLIKPEERLALRLVAPHEDRVRQVMRELNMSENRSREYIESTTRQCHSFVKKHFHADLEDPVHYNLVVNTSLNSPEMIFEIVNIVLDRNGHL